MFQLAGITLELDSSPLWLAQSPVIVPRPTPTPTEAALVFSGPQFFMVLVAGVVLAFAFQILLTNLSVALGISYLGNQLDLDSRRHRTRRDNAPREDAPRYRDPGEGGPGVRDLRERETRESRESRESTTFGGTIRKISTGLGIWTLVTVTIALFLACFLAVQLSLLTALSLGLGAILGIVIWGAYFTLLVWISSTTVGSLIGSVVNTATAGFQSLLGTATAALGAKAASNQVVATAEAAAAAVRRELGSAIHPETIRDTLEDYLQAVRPPELDVQGIRREFDRMLGNVDLGALSPENLGHINRQTFVDLVSSNTKLSKRDINRIADQLEDAWKGVANRVPQRDVMGELLNYLRTAQPGELKSPELNSKLDTLINELRQQRQTMQTQSEQQPTLMDRARQMAMTAITGAVLGRTDLSDMDVQSILHRLEHLKDQVAGTAEQVAEKVPGLPAGTIRNDVENYLLNSYSWHFNRETLPQEFRNVLYDPEANPGNIRRQLENIKRSDFVDLLNQRGDLTPERVAEIADRLENTRLEVLGIVETRDDQEQRQGLATQVENYLRHTGKEELNPEGIRRDFTTLLEDPNAGYEQLRDRLSHFDRDTFVQLLNQRSDIIPEEAERIVSNLEETRDRVLSQAKQLQDRAREEAEALWLSLESYLRNTGKAELNPEGIKRDLATLLDNPEAGYYAIRARLSRFDRDTLVKLLSQRPDLTEEEANRIIDQVQSSWYNVTHAPQILAGKAKEQYDQVVNAIADYLRNTGKAELNPEGIRRDLVTLFSNPRQGISALSHRLSEVDRDTLVKLLSQRQDLTEEEANRIVDQIQVTINTLVRAPRRLASRTQASIQNFQSMLEDYLRNTGKEALNPEGIKRDLALLLHDPRVGMESLGDRLAHIDRDTTIKLLAQRPDMTEAEAARIVDQILSVRDHFVEQVRSVQRRIQEAIDGVFMRIRNYLNSLDRPELNYDGIKRDVRKLFDDPQAGFEALRDRLSHFNRDTLVAILSSRDDISEEDVNRIIGQIEGARDAVLQRAERMQQSVQERVEQVKHQAAQELEETRKAAATASWWLFLTAVVSGLASAIAGMLAVAVIF